MRQSRALEMVQSLGAVDQRRDLIRIGRRGLLRPLDHLCAGFLCAPLVVVSRVSTRV